MRSLALVVVVAAAGALGCGSERAAVKLQQPIPRDGGKYTLAFGDVTFTVGPAAGARVTTFAFKGQNLLTAASDQTSPSEGNWGSTFWPSPQSAWSWPPIPELDNQPYAASLDGDTIVMTGQMSADAHRLKVTKRFSAVLDAQAIDVTYALENDAAAAASWAPWEISRVHTGGLTFFPIPAGNAVITNALPASTVTAAGGVAWYQNQYGDSGKYSVDCAEGWIGQVAGKLLFVKRFTDVPAASLAPGEGDCEFYAGGGYVEIEPQGAYQPLAPGASLTWTVRWYVRELADPASATPGSAALAALARSTIK